MEKKKANRRTTHLNSKATPRIIRASKMRDLLLAHLRAKKMTRYQLAKAVQGKVSEQAVYGYLSKRRDMTSGLVYHLLIGAGLEIRPKE